MDLVVISYFDEFPNEKELIARLFECGMTCFHLRKPGWKSEQIAEFLTDLPREFYSSIVLHDHFDLVEKFGLGGIHFTCRTKSEINKWLKFDGSKSVSCHSLDELKMVNSNIDYAFLSPVFPSISKKGYAGKLEFSQISSFLKSQKQHSIIALGGISEDKIEQVADLGFDGVAVLGTLWQMALDCETIVKRFIKISNTCQHIHL